MSTLVAPDRPKTHTSDIAHGVHVECQYGRPTVKAICGVELEWDDESAPDINETCIVCMDLLVCPICGAEVHA